MTTAQRPRVFCSHASADKPVVLAFAERLRLDGLDAWVDGWEIDSGQDLVGRINDGLAQCTAGLVFFSQHTNDSRWVDAEVNALIYRAVQGLRIVPVLLDDNAELPPLLQHYLRRSVEEYSAIRDTLLGRTDRPALGPLPEQRSDELLVRLTTSEDGTIRSQVWHSAELLADAARPLPALLSASYRPGGTDQALAEVGRACGELMFPAPSAERLAGLLSAHRTGDRISVIVEAVPELALLPYEAARLATAGSPLLVGQPGLTLLRRPLAPPARLAPALPGPLKILIAVAAPDIGKTANTVLDSERELARILNALPEHGAQARPLEVASLEETTSALRTDAYHVLHLSGHGGVEGIELEDEDGNGRLATPEQIVSAIERAGRPLPLVFLSCCGPGSTEDTSSGLALRLLQAGLSQVIAMHGAVSDGYATELAHEFYRILAASEDAEPAEVLAQARGELEQRRQQMLQRGLVVRPEYATATITCWGTPQPVRRSGTLEPLHARPGRPVGGPVPRLGVDDLVGRRAEVREALRVLLDDPRSVAASGTRAGVTLCGVGGVGKSTVAGRVMSRLVDRGWVTATVAGPVDLSTLCTAVAAALDELPDEPASRLAEQLLQPVEDTMRLSRLGRALRDHRLLVVLDNFEDNLEDGGESFREQATEAVVGSLLQAAVRGKLLITSRYPIVPLARQLMDVRITPLPTQQAHKLLLRLPAFETMNAADSRAVLALTGGHPRLLELVDAAARGNTTRLASMSGRLDAHAQALGIDLSAPRADLETALADALEIALRDIALTDLVADLSANEREVLIQAAVSTIPVAADALATILGRAVKPELDRLSRLTLVTPVGVDYVFVERWTAQGLTGLTDGATWRAASGAAAEHRLTKDAEGRIDIDDAMEAVRNYLVADLPDIALARALDIARFLQGTGYLMRLASFAGEVISSVSLSTHSARGLASLEAYANEALGLTWIAFQRWDAIARALIEVLDSEPDRADHQRDLSTSYTKLGDLMLGLGRGEDALRFHQQSLDIATRLGAAEPDRADYQRDLSVSYERLGDLMLGLGRDEDALRFHQQSLDIRTRLAAAEPDRADHQRDLSVSYIKLGDLMRGLGRGEDAQQLFQQSLDIRTRLAAAEPDRSGEQRDLSVSYTKLGDLMLGLGRGEDALRFHQQSLDIATRLGAAEPDRADYQRDLSISYERFGDLMRGLGRGEDALRFHQQSLDIRTRLAAAEPDRSDYQRDLSISYNKLGDLILRLGRGEDAQQLYQHSLDIRTRLAAAEPDRTDYQRDLSIAYERLGDLAEQDGNPGRALELYLQSLPLAGQLAGAQPTNVGLQNDLRITLDRLAALSAALGNTADEGNYRDQAAELAERLGITSGAPDNPDQDG